MKIWINAPFSAENVELIKSAAAGCEVFSGTEAVPGAEIIVGQPPENFSGVKLLQSTNAGVEKLLSVIPAGVIITNVTGAFGGVISEYIVGGVLALSRNLFQYREQQRRHIWQSIPQGSLLYGKNALILGCGDIGASTAEKLREFGMNVTGIRRSPAPTHGFDRVFGMDMLEELLPETDLLICCLPHTPETVGLLSEKRIALLKRDALLVNVGRGSLTDETALINALKSGRLSGAVLDVFAQEPLPESSPLWDMENVLVTPHVSGPSFGHFPEVERNIAGICADNISRYLSGKPLVNVIDRSKGYADRENSDD